MEIPIPLTRLCYFISGVVSKNCNFLTTTHEKKSYYIGSTLATVTQQTILVLNCTLLCALPLLPNFPGNSQITAAHLNTPQLSTPAPHHPPQIPVGIPQYLMGKWTMPISHWAPTVNHHIPRPIPFICGKLIT